MDIKINIPDATAFVLGRLEAAGYSAHIVGGCVRDCYMGKIPHDYDITTNATPDEMLRIFSGCRVVETGLKHGTLTVVYSGENIEVTTYRIDGAYGDSRHPEKVTFTRELESDLCRRDFTINAMAYSPASGLCDLFGGQTDIKNKKIRCVGHAAERFGEDALRILRALRFSSALGFTPDDECRDAILSLYPTLAKISRERIYAETSKLIIGQDAARVLRDYAPVFSFILTGEGYTLGEDAVKAAARAVSADSGLADSADCTADFTVRMATLLDSMSASAAALAMESLKPSRDEKRAVCDLLRYRDCFSGDTFADCGDYHLLHLMSVTSDAFPTRLAHFSHVTGRISREKYVKICALTARLIREDSPRSVSALSVDGHPLAALGLSGASIGESLTFLLDAVMRGEVKNEKTSLTNALIKSGRTDG